MAGKIIRRTSDAEKSIRRLIRQIWANGGIPFEVSQSAPCEELAYGTEGMNYALVDVATSCTASLAALMESHGYDGAIVIGACDKMMVGSLRALIEADLAHQRRKARPGFRDDDPFGDRTRSHICAKKTGASSSLCGIVLPEYGTR